VGPISAEKKDAMVSILSDLSEELKIILQKALLRIRLHLMWGIFRTFSQDGEPVHKTNSSKAIQSDIKTVKTNLEKLRGYHDLAKASLLSPSSFGLPPDLNNH
jgi:hypothetical protein